MSAAGNREEKASCKKCFWAPSFCVSFPSLSPSCSLSTFTHFLFCSGSVLISVLPTSSVSVSGPHLCSALSSLSLSFFLARRSVSVTLREHAIPPLLSPPLLLCSSLSYLPFPPCFPASSGKFAWIAIRVGGSLMLARMPPTAVHVSDVARNIQVADHSVPSVLQSFVLVGCTSNALLFYLFFNQSHHQSRIHISHSNILHLFPDFSIDLFFSWPNAFALSVFPPSCPFFMSSTHPTVILHSLSVPREMSTVLYFAVTLKAAVITLTWRWIGNVMVPCTKPADAGRWIPLN